MEHLGVGSQPCLQPGEREERAAFLGKVRGDKKHLEAWQERQQMGR